MTTLQIDATLRAHGFTLEQMGGGCMGYVRDFDVPGMPQLDGCRVIVTEAEDSAVDHISNENFLVGLYDGDDDGGFYFYVPMALESKREHLWAANLDCSTFVYSLDGALSRAVGAMLNRVQRIAESERPTRTHYATSIDVLSSFVE